MLINIIHKKLRPGLLGTLAWGSLWATGSPAISFADEPVPVPLVNEAGPEMMAPLPPAGPHQVSVLIRPINYDPSNPWEYTVSWGIPSPGMAAGGPIWNRLPIESALPPSAPSLPLSPVPAAATGVEGPAPEAAFSAPVPAAFGTPGPAMSYAQARAIVGFSRAEYEANPSYRHDAAMEIMFGVLRPTTIVKQTYPYFSRYPDFFRYRYSVFPYPPGHGGGVSYPPYRWFYPTVIP